MPQGKASLDTGLFAGLASKVIERLPRDLDPAWVKALIDDPSRLNPILHQAFLHADSTTKRVSRTFVNYEVVLEQLLKLDWRAGVRLRPGFTGGSRWYVGASIYTSTLSAGGYAPLWANGSTPEEAVRCAGDIMLAQSQQTDAFFLICTCAPNVPIPGDDPQVWVRWNQDRRDWVDVVPTVEALAIHHIPADRIRSVREHVWRQRL